jgi:hypothetical protein
MTKGPNVSVVAALRKTNDAGGSALIWRSGQHRRPHLRDTY